MPPSVTPLLSRTDNVRYRLISFEDGRNLVPAFQIDKLPGAERDQAVPLPVIGVKHLPGTISPGYLYFIISCLRNLKIKQALPGKTNQGIRRLGGKRTQKQ